MRMVWLPFCADPLTVVHTSPDWLQQYLYLSFTAVRSCPFFSNSAAPEASRIFCCLLYACLFVAGYFSYLSAAVLLSVCLISEPQVDVNDVTCWAAIDAASIGFWPDLTHDHCLLHPFSRARATGSSGCYRHLRRRRRWQWLLQLPLVPLSGLPMMRWFSIQLKSRRPESWTWPGAQAPEGLLLPRTVHICIIT